jgi:hypothetical protein
MAGDWIKMRGNLWDDPRVAKIVDITDSSEAAVVGALYWLWSTADQHTTDGVMLGLTLRAIDRKTGVAGFADALCAIGWIADHPEGVRIVDFETHNGVSAKKRCQTAKRVANFTASNAMITDESNKTNAASVSTALAREEKRREEEIEPKGSVASQLKKPVCPTSSIVDLYHQALPELPTARLMPESRKKAIAKFWNFVLTSEKTDGTRRATTHDEAIAWVGDFFNRARDNDFLMGRGGKSAGHENWQCDIDFLMTDKGMKHVIEKTKDSE